MNVNDYDGLADIYDTYVPVDFDVPFFLSEAAKTGGDILELMSGTGRVSIPLLKAGHTLTCVDLSAEMNAIHARKLAALGLKAEIITMDVCEMDLARQFPLILIPFHSFGHITSSQGQLKALESIRRHLAPGGTFICTLSNPAPRRASVDGSLRLFRKYPLDKDGVLLLWILEKYHPEDSQVVEAFQFFEEYDASGGLIRKRLMTLQYQFSEREEFEALARSAGFKQKAFYGDYSYGEFHPQSSPSMIWLLE